MKEKEINIDSLLEKIHWLGHATIKINGTKTIYVDPYELSEDAEKADIILITHNHYDHLSVEDIKKISNERTVVVIPASLLVSLKNLVNKVDIGQTISVKGVQIKAVPAYNIVKSFHPRSQGYVGYVFTLDGIIYYHAGDTDHIPEMRGIDADVVFLPVGGTYTMKSFCLVAMAGIGNLPMIAVGSLILGISESAIQALPDGSGWAPLVFFGLIIAVILVRSFRRAS